jgi:hypothetical protein
MPAMTIRVIGAGFGRTGTSTLKWALERLLGGRCHHMREVFEHPEQVRVWAAKARGEPVDLAPLLRDYVATCDWPSAAWYDELAERFPNAKVVLTTRDFDKWYESALETIYAVSLTVERPPVSWLVRTNPRMRQFPQMTNDVIWGERGCFGGRFHEREHAREVYERHIEAVKRKIPAERLLVYAPSEGWEPLCRFLDLPIPSEPMARKNERDEMIAIRRRMTAVAWLVAPITGPLALGLRALGR